MTPLTPRAYPGHLYVVRHKKYSACATLVQHKKLQFHRFCASSSALTLFRSESYFLIYLQGVDVTTLVCLRMTASGYCLSWTVGCISASTPRLNIRFVRVNMSFHLDDGFPFDLILFLVDTKLPKRNPTGLSIDRHQKFTYEMTFFCAVKRHRE